MKIVILCGGKGTRLGFETKIIPKPMAKIDNDPIVLHIMNYYMKFGFNDFILALGCNVKSLTSSTPVAANFGIILRVLNYSEINAANAFDPSSFNAADKRNTGYFRMENSIPTVAEIGRTHCNIVNTYATQQKQKRTSQKVHCYSRWGTGTNDYEETIIDNPF